MLSRKGKDDMNKGHRDQERKKEILGNIGWGEGARMTETPRESKKKRNYIN